MKKHKGNMMPEEDKSKRITDKDRYAMAINDIEEVILDSNDNDYCKILVTICRIIRKLR